MQQVRIVWRDSSLVVIEKPAGIPVHPPERPGERQSGVDLIRILRAQLGVWGYPVHRLDQATSGLMLWALDSETAARVQAQFQAGRIQKTYLALVRGWLRGAGTVDSPLSSEHDPSVMKPAETRYQGLHAFELPVPDRDHPTSRYSLVSAQPVTGRWHQIRRHLKRLSHPIIGDTVHGDGVHNRVWREQTGDHRLYLLAWQLVLEHPHSGERLSFQARFPGVWHRVFDRAGFCPSN
jgi:tRNA pseudouridine65 synthase